MLKAVLIFGVLAFSSAMLAAPISSQALIHGSSAIADADTSLIKVANRKGSKRVGGAGGHGKGSKYVGGKKR